MVKCEVLVNATRRGLTEFAQQGKEHAALVEKLLADNALRKEMLIAGGAQNGKCGRAMQIHREIQKASTKAGERSLQLLAPATSLEPAGPVEHGGPVDQPNATCYRGSGESLPEL